MAGAGGLHSVRRACRPVTSLSIPYHTNLVSIVVVCVHVPHSPSCHVPLYPCDSSRWDHENSCYVPTPLGKAGMASNIDPKEAQYVRRVSSWDHLWLCGHSVLPPRRAQAPSAED